MAGTKRKAWSYLAGEKGRNRVRVYEDGPGGVLLVEFYKGSGGRRKRQRVSLGHRDRLRAKRQADEIAAGLGQAVEPQPHDPTLEELFDIYLGEVTPSKGVSKRKHDHRCAEMMLRFLGRRKKARTLDRRDWDAFIRARRTGSLKPEGSRREGGVGDRQVGYDLKFLIAVLNWATDAGPGTGEPFLDRNPLKRKSIKLPEEKSPKRPTLTEERYRRMLAVSHEIDWRFHVALVLAHETGHRSNSVAQLRWDDVDLAAGRIRWRADSDKMGREHVTPILEEALGALGVSRECRPGIGTAWVLPAPKDPDQHVSRHLLRDWWRRAEERAGLEPVEQLGWHSLRRKFANDLKDMPMKDLCALGGWKDERTVLKCYQKADEDRMRRALESRRALSAG